MKCYYLNVHFQGQRVKRLISSRRASALYHSRDLSVLRALSNKHYENDLVLPPVSQQAVCVMAILIAFFFTVLTKYLTKKSFMR